ncbi:hypothetical protein [Pengzhenrongella frigida]|uniref:Alkaline shock response membrane anchor protein AmaP n=1 Tax=Pengzhenrongella frigida TaxID=1259133 RepID=A0A4V1ZH53_9MICO|nr:hypothetical protein [Cellulomonas sp. HLT2-17]RYV50844.1 hypothetical protein EUA98_11265 [Cellulomonas sp. HLT2-17]
MSRATIAADRVATFVVAVILIGVGVTAIAWWLDLFTWMPARLDLTAALDLVYQSWWPWAAGVAGLVAVLVGLRWLIAHVPDRGVGDLKLAGSGPGGKLRAAASPVAEAAAQVLAGAPGVRSASGKVLHERGQLVARLTGTIETGADLHAIAQAADKVAAELGAVLGRNDLLCQVQLKTATRTRVQPRVR